MCAVPNAAIAGTRWAIRPNRGPSSSRHRAGLRTAVRHRECRGRSRTCRRRFCAPWRGRCPVPGAEFRSRLCGGKTACPIGAPARSGGRMGRADRGGPGNRLCRGPIPSGHRSHLAAIGGGLFQPGTACERHRARIPPGQLSARSRGRPGGAGGIGPDRQCQSAGNCRCRDGARHFERWRKSRTLSLDLQAQCPGREPWPIGQVHDAAGEPARGGASPRSAVCQDGS
jgi:hypothetical protein